MKQLLVLLFGFAFMGSVFAEEQAAKVTFKQPVAVGQLPAKAARWAQQGAEVTSIIRSTENSGSWGTDRMPGESMHDFIARFKALGAHARSELMRVGTFAGPADESTDIEVTGNPGALEGDELVKAIEWTSGCPVEECASPFTIVAQ